MSTNNNPSAFMATHPGEILTAELLERGITPKALANHIGVSYKALNDLLNEHRPVTIEIAMFIEAALGISATNLLKLQMEYDIFQLRQDKDFQERLVSIRKVAVML